MARPQSTTGWDPTTKAELTNPICAIATARSAVQCLTALFGGVTVTISGSQENERSTNLLSYPLFDFVGLPNELLL